MRIVQLANFHGPTSGGIRTVLRAWAAGYREHGHVVHTVVPGAVDRTLPTWAGITHQLAAPRVPGAGGYRVIWDWEKVGRVLDRIEPDVVEVSDRLTLLPAADWARPRGVTSALVLHERLDHQLRRFLPGSVPVRRLVDAWNGRWLGRFDRLIATSRFGTREATRIGLGPVAIVPLGVDLSLFRPRSRPNERRRRIRLVYLGRISPEKRPDLALAVVRELIRSGHQAELTVLGDGPMRRRLARQGRDLPVGFSGHVSARADVAGVLGAADVSIVPCPGECFGLAALESMACGTPVVVAAASGAAELVASGGGLAVRPDPVSMSRAVEQILEEPASDRRDRARAVASRYPWSVSVEAMLDSYRVGMLRDAG